MPAPQASQTGGLPFPEKGSLKKVPFARMLRDLARAQMTGRLYLLSGETKKVVFFEEGTPVFVRSNVLAECLGQILAGEGLITQEQCDQTLEAIRRTGKKQGELLVEMGILSEENLRYALAAQLRQKLWAVFEWERGRYRFQPGPTNQDIRIELGRSPEGLVLEAIQNVVTEDRAGRALEPYLSTYPVLRHASKFDGKALGMLPEEIFFAKCLDGSRTVSEVLDENLQPEPPTPKALLHGLLQAGVVQLAKKVRKAGSRPKPPQLVPDHLDDTELAPEHEARSTITEYEDTPLPGELPAGLGDPNQDGPDGGFDSVALEASGPIPTDLAAELEAAESDAVDPSFDADIELSDEDVALVEDDEDEDDEDDGATDSGDTGGDGAKDGRAQAEDDFEATRERAGVPELMQALPRAEAEAGAPEPIDDLVSMEELDDVDLDPMGDLDDLGDGFDGDLADDGDGLDADDDLMGSLEADDDLALDAADDDLLLEGGEEPTTAHSADPLANVQPRAPDPPPADSSTRDEMQAARDFADAEAALAQNDFAMAVVRLESAYASGFDVAELHAMLAYARFMALGDPDQASEAFELLAYAESVDPNLDLVHAYRGAILRAIGKPGQARSSLERALEINPYCDLAMQIMDSLGAAG